MVVGAVVKLPFRKVVRAQEKPLVVTGSLLEGLLAYAEVQAPYEACGLVADYGGDLAFLPASNVSAEPRTSFLIGADEQRRLLAMVAAAGAEVVALFHSHPRSGPEPSERDLELAAGWPGLTWLIAGLGGDRPRLTSQILVPK